MTALLESSFTSTGMKILVVEDEGIVARDLKQRLERNGFEVTGIADNAEDAMRLVEENPPDLVLMDIVIQGDRDGIATAEEVRTRHDIPVIFLTAHSDPATIEKAKSALPYGYLIKPFEERELLTAFQMAVLRHKNESKLRLYERAIAATTTGLILTDASEPDNPIISCSAGFERITGYTEAEVIGRNPRFLQGPDSDPVAVQTMREAIREGRECQVTLLNYRKDGTPFWDEIRISPVRNGAGKLTHFVGIQNDITEIKQSRDRIHQQAQLIEQATDAIFVCDLDGQITFVNPAAARLYGFDDESEAPNLPASAGILKGIQKDYESLLQNARSSGTSHGEVKCQTSEGRGLVTLSRITALFDETGNPTGFLMRNHDITEQRELERKLERSQRQEILGSLAGGIAHDLNNALAPILMGIDLLKVEYPKESMMIDLFEISADRAAKMVRKMLTFAKGLGSDIGSIEASHLIREMKDIIGSTFPKNIQAVFDYENDLPLIKGNAIQMHQVLLNLCVNARDAMPEGGTLTLTAKLTEIGRIHEGMPCDSRPGHFVALSVEDTGGGIPPELRKLVFEPFFSTKAPGKGTGLGLSTTRGIVHTHGGFLQVAPASCQGTKFTVFLPVQEADIPAIHQAKLKTSYHGRGEIILFVDDDPAIRRIAQVVLQRLDFKVFLAQDGIEGFELASKHRSVLGAVITDMQMPNQDGFEFINLLRRVLPNIPVVVSSGMMEDGMKEKFEALGPVSFLCKPFTEDLMAEVLRGVFLPTKTKRCVKLPLKVMYTARKRATASLQ